MSDSGSSSDDDVPNLVSRLACAKVADEDHDFDDEDQLVDSLNPAIDLFSKKSFKTAEDCLEHCRDVHGIDLSVLKKRHNMDTFSFIRFINYLRSELPSPGFVMSLSSDTKWEDDKFMKPVIDDDPLLMFNLDDDAEMFDDDENGFEIDISRELDDQIENPRSSKSAGGGSRSRVETRLSEQIEGLQRELEEKQGELAQCREDMIKMRTAAQTLFSGLEESSRKPTSNSSVVSVSEHKTVEQDSSYFESYAHYSIHYDMLSDKVRTESYRDALLKNAGSLAGSKVLDIGCGTGILSMFAAQAGAGRVVGVDCSDIIYQAMDIVQENKLKEKITLVKGRLEETDLPEDKFNFIISEWMGYFLLFEGMLDSVISARDKYLVPGGMVLPNRCTISLTAISDTERYNSLVGFWEDVYGYKMSCMRNPILEEASVEVVPSSAAASTSATVLSLDLNTCTVEDTQFTSTFDLTISRDCDLTAILGHFDTFFDLPEPVMFSTGPSSVPTHWKQTVFYLPSPMPVKLGQVLNCKIVCKRMQTDARALKVALTIDKTVLKYTVD
jgi:protein arginine N-methyltransferase 3